MKSINQNIAFHFTQTAKAFPEKKAIIHNGKSITYVELLNLVQSKVSYFQSKGIQPGDRILVFVPMSIELYANVLALFYMGATAVFLDEWVNRERLNACCKLSSCKGFIAPLTIRLLALTSKELRRIPVWLKTGKSVKGNPNLFECNGHETALLTFTTGSTGVPKAAKRSHAFLNEQFEALKNKIQPNSNDVDLTNLPIVLLINLGIGSTSVIAGFNAKNPNKTNFKELKQFMIDFKVSRMEASPFFIEQLAKHLVATEGKLPELKKIFTGGAPVFPDEAVLMQSAFNGCTVEVVYGSTEAEPISSILTKELIEKYGSVDKGLCVGIPYAGTQVKIIKIKDDPIVVSTKNEFNEWVVPTGTTGEIIVSGKHVLREYYNNEEAILRNKIMVDDECWHRTGDSGHLDGNGNLFLMGRCASLVKRNDQWLSPFIYENFLKTHVKVTAGTFVELNGKVIVVLEANSTELSDVENLLKKHDYYFDEIRVLNSIPRDPRHFSKIDYAKLKSILSRP